MFRVQSEIFTTVVSRIAGGVLLVAGLAKFTGGDGSGAFPAFLPSWLIGTVPVFEILLAVWLFSGQWRFGSWMIAQVAFAIFTLVTLSQIQAGKSDCGCFGAAKVPPYFTFGLDICLTALLLRARPAWAGWPGREVQTLALTASVAAVVVGIASGYAYLRYGSVQAGIAAAAGLPVTVTTQVVDLGKVSPDALVDSHLEVINLTGEDVQLAIISTRCRCAEFHDLPVTLTPNRAVRIALTLRAPTATGPFRREGEIRSSAGVAKFEMVGYVVSDR